MMKFKFEKVANMVFLSTEDIIWKAWNEEDFTERKAKNAERKILKDTNGNAEFEYKF